MVLKPSSMINQILQSLWCQTCHVIQLAVNRRLNGPLVKPFIRKILTYYLTKMLCMLKLIFDRELTKCTVLGICMLLLLLFLGVGSRVRQLFPQRGSRDFLLAKLIFWTLYFHQQNDNKIGFFFEKNHQNLFCFTLEHFPASQHHLKIKK